CLAARLFRADVLQAFRQAVSIDPRVLHVFVDVVFRDPYGAPAGPEPNVRQPPLGTEEVYQGFRTTESCGRLANGKKFHDTPRPEAVSPVEARVPPGFPVAPSTSSRTFLPRQPQHQGLAS